MLSLTQITGASISLSDTSWRPMTSPFLSMVFLSLMTRSTNRGVIACSLKGFSPNLNLHLDLVGQPFPLACGGAESTAST